MPVFEYACVTESCDHYMVPFERFFHASQSTEPAPCETCQGETVKLVSSFAFPWSGTLDRFFDPKCSRVNQIDGGHIAYRVKSSRLADGSPEPVRITSRQDQISFIKAEQCSDPFDTNHSGDRDYNVAKEESKVRLNARGVWQ
jgi:putative FmdB family regulatory protein